MTFAAKYEVVKHPRCGKGNPSPRDSVWTVRNKETGLIGDHRVLRVNAESIAIALNRGQYSSASMAAEWAAQLELDVRAQLVKESPIANSADASLDALDWVRKIALDHTKSDAEKVADIIATLETAAASLTGDSTLATDAFYGRRKAWRDGYLQRDECEGCVRSEHDGCSEGCS